MEDRAGAGLRQRRDPQTRRANAAHRAPPRRVADGSRYPGGGGEHHHWLRTRGGQLDRGPSGCRQGRVYRLDRGRQGDPQGLGRELEARVAGARRQVAQHHLSRCGFAGGGAQLDARHLHDPRASLRRRIASPGSGRNLRSVRRRAFEGVGGDEDRRSARSGNPDRSGGVA